MIGWQLVSKMPNPDLEGDWEKEGVKEHVRQEASRRCVYCGIHENFIGGIRAFHKDHYRPKARFVELKDVLDNIYYSCQFCNIFKSDNWPNDPKDDHSVAAFANPSHTDYNELFNVNWDKGYIEGIYNESRYIDNQLYLNRPQLTLTRQEYALRRRKDAAVEKIETILVGVDEYNSEIKKLLEEYFSIAAALRILLEASETIPRYEPEDVRR